MTARDCDAVIAEWREDMERDMRSMTSARVAGQRDRSKNFLVRERRDMRGWDVFKPTGGRLGTWCFHRDALQAVEAEGGTATTERSNR